MAGFGSISLEADFIFAVSSPTRVRNRLAAEALALTPSKKFQPQPSTIAENELNLG